VPKLLHKIELILHRNFRF